MREGKVPGLDDGDRSPVPEAMGRLLALVEARIGPEKIDRVWIFPPLSKGRKEWGLVAVSCFQPDPGQRALMTCRYSAELTGTGVAFVPELVSQGVAPPDLLGRIMDGVVRRSDLPLGTPREVEVCGSRDRFHDLRREHGLEGAPEVGLEP